MTTTTQAADTRTTSFVLSLLALAMGGFAIGTTEFMAMGLLPQVANGVDVSIPSAGHLISAYALGVVVGAPVLAFFGARLPRTPNLAAFWRPFLRKALPDEGLIVDLRSGGYAAAWAPKAAERVTVRAFTPDGKSISHMVKATRGDVARVLLEQPADTAAEVAEIVAAAGYRVELNNGSLDVLDQRPAA